MLVYVSVNQWQNWRLHLENLYNIWETLYTLVRYWNVVIKGVSLESMITFELRWIFGILLSVLIQYFISINYFEITFLMSSEKFRVWILHREKLLRSLMVAEQDRKTLVAQISLSMVYIALFIFILYSRIRFYLLVLAFYKFCSQRKVAKWWRILWWIFSII